MKEHYDNTILISECLSFRAILDALAEAVSALSFCKSEPNEESIELNRCRSLILECKKSLILCLLAILRNNPNSVLIKEKTLASFSLLSSCWEALPPHQNQKSFIRVTPPEIESSLGRLLLDASAIHAAKVYERQLLLEAIDEP